MSYSSFCIALLSSCMPARVEPIFPIGQLGADAEAGRVSGVVWASSLCCQFIHRLEAYATASKKKPPSGKYHSAVLVLLLEADYRQDAESSSRATKLGRRLCGSLLSSLLLGYFLLGCSLLRCCCLLGSFLSYLLLRCPSFFLGHGYILRKAKLLVAAPIEHQKQ